jgi:hypothetical protein
MGVAGSSNTGSSNVVEAVDIFRGFYSYRVLEMLDDVVEQACQVAWTKFKKNCETEAPVIERHLREKFGRVILAVELVGVLVVVQTLLLLWLLWLVRRVR